MSDIYDDDQDIFYHVLESMPGVVVTDLEGKIVFLSDKYAEILKVNRQEVIGKDVAAVIPGTRMHIVAKTCREEMGSLFKLKNGESVLVNRILVKKEGQIIGVAAFSSLSAGDELSTDTTIRKISHLSQELNQYRKVAQTKSTVVINGETGTGKELVAHAIHQQSNRNYQPFIRVNCAAIPGNLLESELFGYEEGAFTGAKKGGKVGKFELADCGTLLLDEVNQMPLYLQSKLLRVIQEKEVERVGGNKPQEIDVRLIFTTNQNLLDLVQEGRFREDLYYRINVVSIEIPTLRSRVSDLPLLTGHFITKINKELGLSITGIDDQVIAIFQQYHWPGNIRELENTIERAANLALQGNLRLEHFEHFLLRVKKERHQPENEADLESVRSKAEKETIIRVLAQTNANISAAARILGINRSVLYERLRKYNLQIK